MRSKNRLYRLHIVIAVVIAAAVLLLVTDWELDLDQSPSSSITTTSPVTEPTSLPDVTLVDPEHDEVLSSNIEGFIAAYYQRLPDDTAETYVERLTPYVSQDYLNQLDLTQFERDPFLSMSERGSSIEVRFDEGDISITYDAESPTIAWVVVLMDQYELSAAGDEEVLRQSMESATEWRRVDGHWLVFPSLPR